jgi:long-chain alkane monooxygenase
MNHNEAASYGDGLMAHNIRYERADEFMEACIKLWNSWEPDAVVEGT